MNLEQLLKELDFEATKSSGAGGQHVNKVATKVQLAWHVENSSALEIFEKEAIKDYCKHLINDQGFLKLSASNSRSQFQNKKTVIQKFIVLIEKATTPKKKRLTTKKPSNAIQKRLNTKKKQSEIKQMRKKIY